MFSKFSVKKPYTVVVGIVLVLVLGFVSFTNMKTDLLPEMSLPYAVVYTTYGGASPEEVELVVTKPVEQVMATVSNIENVTSISSENISVVVLEFAQSANMDAVTIEMRENLDQIEGYWDEGVGSPIIMKINPDMMPVVVAAVEAGDMSSAELTDYVSDKILPELESLEGVASVTTTGDVEEQVQVILRQEKIDAVNKRVSDAIDGKFSEAESELADAKAELEDGKRELEEGQNSLSEQTSSAEAQIANGQNELITSEVELEQKLVEVEEKLLELAAAEEEVKTQEGELAAAEEQLAALPEQLAQAQAGLAGLETGISSLETAAVSLGEVETVFVTRDQLREQIEQLENTPGTPAATIAALQQQLATIEEQLNLILEPLAAAGVTTTGSYSEVQESLNTKKAELAAQKTQLESQIGQLQAAVDDIPNQKKTIQDAKGKIKTAKKEMADGKTQLEDAKTQLESARTQIASGKTTLAVALAQLNANKISATIEIAAGKAAINSGETGIEQAEEQLGEQKDSAYDQADVTKIITADMIKGILTAQNFSMPAGYVTEEGIDYLVRIGNKLGDATEMEELILMDMHMDSLDPIKLSDVADVVFMDTSEDVYATINGFPGIMLTIQKQSGYSTGEVSERINEKLAELEENLTEAHAIVLMDQGIYIDMAVSSVVENMLYGAVLAVLILLVFLKSLRPTIVIAFSIPISILAAVVLMYFTGINLNMISLSGLALGVGMLVDNSIVVIENIYRLRGLGIPAKKAAIQGAGEMGGAIAASTLTTICVFAPIIFTEGITRQLFVDMGLTIAYSLLASLLVALTVVPMMGAGLLKNTKEKKSPWFEKIQNVYAKVLAVALRHRAIVLIGALGLLVLSIVLSLAKGTQFIPDMESTQVSITMEMNTEDVTLTDVSAMSDQVIARIREIEDVEDVGAMAGESSIMSMMGSSSAKSVDMYLILKDDMQLSNEELVAEIEKRTADLDCALNIQTNMMDMSALGGSGISVQVKGRELDQLKEIATEVAAIIETVEGTVNVSDGIEEKTLEMRVVVDKAKAMEYQLTTAQVYQFLQSKLTEAASATTLSTASKDYDVLVVSDSDEELTRSLIKGLSMEGTNEEGDKEEVLLRDLVTFEEAEGFLSINREGQERYVTVSAELDNGYNIGLVSTAVEDALADYTIPQGYSIEMTGENETINEALGEVMKMLALAVVLIYLIMVAQFQSLLSPFIIMFTIPLAFTGGFFGLWLTNKPLSVIAMIGFVMLSGIIVNNGIVLVDYINQLRLAGKGKREAIIESGRTRLRPIIMTALTTILGLSTMALGLGMGADLVQPMAIVAIGGLIYGTMLTLFVVPCIYDILNRKKIVIEEEV